MISQRPICPLCLLPDLSTSASIISSDWFNMILGLDSALKHLGNKSPNIVLFGDKRKLSTWAQAWKRHSGSSQQHNRKDRRWLAASEPLIIAPQAMLHLTLCGESETWIKRERVEMKTMQWQVSLCRVLDLKIMWQREMMTFFRSRAYKHMVYYLLHIYHMLISSGTTAEFYSVLAACLLERGPWKVLLKSIKSSIFCSSCKGEAIKKNILGKTLQETYSVW